jgi:hypothetical protein
MCVEPKSQWRLRARTTLVLEPPTSRCFYRNPPHQPGDDRTVVSRKDNRGSCSQPCRRVSAPLHDQSTTEVDPVRRHSFGAPAQEYGTKRKSEEGAAQGPRRTSHPPRGARCGRSSTDGGRAAHRRRSGSGGRAFPWLTNARGVGEKPPCVELHPNANGGRAGFVPWIELPYAPRST